MDKLSVERARRALQVTQKAVANLGTSLPALRACADLIRKEGGDIIVTGIGKSGFVGRKIASTLTSLGHRAFFLHPAEAIHGDVGALSRGDVLIALSFSGESKEVVKIVEYAKKNFKVPVIAFTGKKRSALGRIADCCVLIRADKEGSPNEMAPMASTTATLVLGDMLAAMLTGEDFKEESFAKLHPGGSLGLSLSKVSGVMQAGRRVPVVQSSAPVPAVLSEIDKKGLGITAVVDGHGRLVGAVTDGDVRRFLLRGGDVPTAAVRDVMAKRPKYIQKQDSLKVALALMEKHKITSLFVADEGKKPIGIIHIHDILERAFAS